MDVDMSGMQSSTKSEGGDPDVTESEKKKLEESEADELGQEDEEGMMENGKRRGLG